MNHGGTRHRPGWSASALPSLVLALAPAILLLASAPPAHAQSLRGSSSSLDRQNRAALEHDLSFLESSRRVKRFAEMGLLVPVRGNADYEVHQVSFPYARPEVLTFIERLASQYRSACGERLVVTSLTRPQNRQPRNASSRSVHPTGMAVDLRRSNTQACRIWLERVLLSLETEGVLEATRERRPPHYHIAVFPKHYRRYVERLVVAEAAATDEEEATRYRVRSGDSLWRIATHHGTTVDRIRAENGLDGNRIYAGQLLRVPSGR